MTTPYEWAMDLEVVDAETPPKATPRAPGAGKPQLELPVAIQERLEYVSDSDWFAVKDIPSATAANALIYKVRQFVRHNDNGLSIKVDEPTGMSTAKLLELARAEKSTGNETSVSLRFHVKPDVRKGVGRPKTVKAISDADASELSHDWSNGFGEE